MVYDLSGNGLVPNVGDTTGAPVEGGAAVWGDITGTLTDQEDLAAALDDKASVDYLSNAQRTLGYSYYSDFMSGVLHELNVTSSGTSAGVAAGTSTINNPGVGGVNTGTTATGRCSVMSGSQSVLFGGGTWTIEGLMNFPTLPTALEDFAMKFGFMDDVTGAAPTDGAYFSYDFTGSQWVATTVSNSVPTNTSTGVVATTATFNHLKIAVNADATSVVFTIDGVVKATHTTNIPSGVGRYTGWGIAINKTVGTGGRTFVGDWMSVEYVPTAPLVR